jgi:hypothetical protein
VSAFVGKAFVLASARAAVQFPHGTTDADALADILRGAIADIGNTPDSPASILREFIQWRDRAQDGDEGCDYLNGDGADKADGWDDLDLLAERGRAVLAKLGELA